MIIYFYYSWFQRHIKDEFVKSSKIQGYRARSAFKLIQILGAYPQLLKSLKKSNAKIIDIGAAPGSWSQVLANHASPSAKIVGIDLLPIKPIDRVQTFAFDFTSNDSVKIVSEAFSCGTDEQFVDFIVSDLCANLSGNSCIDNSKNLHLWELALKFVILILARDGHFIMKYFESNESILFRKNLESCFQRVFVFKPSASRNESSEKYFICLNKN